MFIHVIHVNGAILFVHEPIVRGGLSTYKQLYVLHAGVISTDSGHNGHKPKRPKPKRPQTEKATNRNGHIPERPETETATNRNGHRPERPQTETATDRKATNRNGHKPKRPQTGTATKRNRHNYIWFSELQNCVLNRNFKLVSRSRQK